MTTSLYLAFLDMTRHALAQRFLCELCSTLRYLASQYNDALSPLSFRLATTRLVEYVAADGGGPHIFLRPGGR